MTNQLINEPKRMIDILQEQNKVFKTALDKETEPDKKNILVNTIWQSQILIDKLGNKILQDLANKLKQLEPQLQEGLVNLEDVQLEINNTVNILKAAQKVTSIVMRISALL